MVIDATDVADVCNEAFFNINVFTVTDILVNFANYRTPGYENSEARFEHLDIFMRYYLCTRHN